MCRENWIITIGIVVCFTLVSFSQTPAGNDGGKEEKATPVETDAIFDEILQSLPGQLRAEVDSANRAGGPPVQAPDAEMIRIRSEEQERLRQEALSELPEQLREQVEKTISHMEENLQERQLQFKDQKGEMQGKK